VGVVIAIRKSLVSYCSVILYVLKVTSLLLHIQYKDCKLLSLERFYLLTYLSEGTASVGVVRSDWFRTKLRSRPLKA